jgi:hypothetical protein
MTSLASVSGAPALGDFIGLQAEDQHVFGANAISNFDVGAIECSDGERAVQRELHVAGPGRLHPGSGDLLGKIGGRNDRFGKADVVVGQEGRPSAVRVRRDHH